MLFLVISDLMVDDFFPLGNGVLYENLCLKFANKVKDTISHYLWNPGAHSDDISEQKCKHISQYDCGIFKEAILCSFFGFIFYSWLPLEQVYML